jgi:hypothetical protein
MYSGKRRELGTIRIIINMFVKKPNGFHCECPEEGGIFGRFCQVRAPRGCQGENVRKMGKRLLLRSVVFVARKNLTY